VLIAVALNAPAAAIEVSDDVPATAMDVSVGTSNNSPALVADPTNDQFVVLPHRIDAPDFGCALQVSGDGGSSWLPSNPVPTLPEGVEKCYASEAAFDRKGVLYLLFVGLAGNGNQPVGAYLTQSRDHAQTFTSPQQILGPHNFSVRLAIDPTFGATGRIHIAWLHAGETPGLGGFPPTANPIMSFHSDDGGRTFSDPIQVSGDDQHRVVAPALALGPDHHVYVAYYDLLQDARDYQGLEGPVWEGNWSINIAMSSNGGSQFERAQVIDDQIVPYERVMLIFTMPPPTVATWGNHVCVGWSDARHGDADVLVGCSASRGGRWDKPVRVNDDPIANGYRQFLPHLSASPSGRLDVVYLDRDVPLGLFNETAYTFSTDGGHRFQPSRHVASARSYIRIGAKYGVISAQGLVEFGSRLGSLSRDDGVVLAWPDTRHAYSKGTDQDIFTARVSWVGRSHVAWYGMLGLSAGALIVFLLCFRLNPAPSAVDSGLVRPGIEGSAIELENVSLSSSDPTHGVMAEAAIEGNSGRKNVGEDGDDEQAPGPVGSDV
jgi:hypothetical protein